MESQSVPGRRLVFGVIGVLAAAQTLDVALDLMVRHPADWPGAMATAVLCVYLYRGSRWARWITVAIEAVLAVLILGSAALTISAVTGSFFASPEDIGRRVPIALPWGQYTLHSVLPYAAIYLVAVGLLHAGCAFTLSVPASVRAFFSSVREGD